MTDNIPPDLRKWIKKCLKAEFGNIVEEAAANDQECSDIVQTVIHSKDMASLLNSIKIIIAKRYTSKFVPGMTPDSRPQSSLSFTSDLTTDDWSSPKDQGDQYNGIIEKISCDKPVHVRLAGYELLLGSELSNVNNNQSWDVLQKVLTDGLMDESRAVFEASLRVHAKLLNCLQSCDVYTNLLNAFNAQYHTSKQPEMLPTLISGINFKIFLHEKLFRIMHLIINHQQEILKSVRNVDKSVEEIIEQLIIFLSSHTFGSMVQAKTLSTLNIISILEPEASWSKRWIRTSATRRIFFAVLAKSSSFVKQVIECVNNGLGKTFASTSASICDDPLEVCISGNTIKTATYLHCLSFLSQLCSYEAGRTLLLEGISEVSFSISEFMISLLHLLNDLALSEAPSGVYDISSEALQTVLSKFIIFYDYDFYHVAICESICSSEDQIKMWPHTLDIISHMLNTTDGLLFLISVCNKHSVHSETFNYPVVTVIQYMSNLLKQPLSIMNTDYIFRLCKVVADLFLVYDIYEIAQDVIENQLYEAILYFYNKVDKYHVDNGTKTQHIDSTIKKLLLRIVSIPLGLQTLTYIPVVFEELIRGSIAPLRTSWTSTEIVSFVSSASSFQSGYNVLVELAPHVLSTLLSETCQILEDLQYFYDPWDHKCIQTFLHILTIFSLNFKCFIAFMTNSKSQNNEAIHPSNLPKLLHESINFDSSYHYLGLISLDAMIWNLDIHIYLLNLLNFQDTLLEFQKYHIYTNETEDELKTGYIIDAHSLLRHRILFNSYCISHKYTRHAIPPEEYQLFSSLPPPPSKLTRNGKSSSAEEEYDSELESALKSNKPGLLDDSWISEVITAHKTSRGPIKNAVLINLVNQMQKTVPTVEWLDHFKWEDKLSHNMDFWFSEEIDGIELTLCYGEQNRILKNTAEAKETLKLFFETTYAFIQYEKPNKFDGFDWFLATVFLICEGNINKSKTFIMHLIHFPSTIFLWNVFRKIIDRNDHVECATQFTFLQLLESVVSNELPNVKYALKNSCGVDWWMICKTMMSQCFWGILPWHEIKHFFIIYILYPPDYLLYYCVSLLHHSQNILLQDLADGKLWPEHMVLDNYQCHDYIDLMNSLDKRYRNKILSKLILKKQTSADEI